MIRDKNKIYGEANDPNTVLADGALTNNHIMLGANNKGAKVLNTASAFISTDVNGNVHTTAATANKLLGTDANGNPIMTDSWTDLNKSGSTGSAGKISFNLGNAVRGDTYLIVYELGSNIAGAFLLSVGQYSLDSSGSVLVGTSFSQTLPSTQLRITTIPYKFSHTSTTSTLTIYEPTDYILKASGITVEASGTDISIKSIYKFTGK